MCMHSLTIRNADVSQSDMSASVSWACGCAWCMAEVFSLRVIVLNCTEELWRHLGNVGVEQKMPHPTLGQPEHLLDMMLKKK